MSNYIHLTREERYQIQAYKKAGFSQVEIAKELMVHKLNRYKSCHFYYTAYLN